MRVSHTTAITSEYSFEGFQRISWIMPGNGMSSITRPVISSLMITMHH